MMLYEKKLFKPLAARINKKKPRIKTGSKLPLLPILGISAILLFGLVIVVIKHKGRQ